MKKATTILTLEEAKTNTGKIGIHTVGYLLYDVRVMDVKSSFGRIRYLVTPVKGTGQVWVESTKIDFDKK